MVRTIKLGDSGYLMLVEADGNVLVDPSDATHNFKPLAGLGANYGLAADARCDRREVRLRGPHGT